MHTISRPPPAKRVDVVESYHGKMVSDPYRWLEDPDAAETQEWVAAHNRRSRAYFESVPARPQIRARIEELWNFPRFSAPRRRQSWYFFTHNPGLLDQPILYRRSGDSTPEVVLDPNTLSGDGAIALIDFSVSDDGALMAYTLAEAGSDWQVVRLMDLRSGRALEDELRFAKFTTLAWVPDGSGFFYQRYPDPASIPDAPPSTHHKVYFHEVGTRQNEDLLVYERPDDPDLGFSATVTDDGAYLVVHAWRGTDPRNGLLFRPLASSSDVVRLIEDGRAKFEFAGNVGSRFVLMSDLEAPRGRVIVIDVPSGEPTELVGEREDTLQSAIIVGDRIFCLYLRDASHRVETFDVSGVPRGEVPLPGLGSIVEISGRQRDDEAFLGFQSQLYPPTVLRFALQTGETSTFFDPKPAFDPTRFQVLQLFAMAEDGVRIPMFLTCSRDARPGRSNPTLLYGYGGFDISLTPAFAPARIAFLERGGIVVDANLRGGGEYGDEWHRAGMLGNKQRVFDDFAAVARFLNDEEWTSPEKLAIFGGSNGGLLVAASVLQHPELFGAAVAAVPVADMLRYHRFTAGRYWIPEYGNAEENPEHFEFLYAYSPVHNVLPDPRRPPVLLATAETDDRVVPMHAWKLAAALQEAATPEQVVLLRTERRAGHGLGKPTSKVIEEAADIYTFLIDALGVT